MKQMSLQRLPDLNLLRFGLSRAKGKQAEDIAISYLQDRGFKIVDRNYYSRFGEIDIIALKDEVLHFIEVKSGEWNPIYQITPSKISKILKTAEIYMSKKKLDFDYSFDALIISEDIEFIENITF
jgi:putative endonuclease